MFLKSCLYLLGCQMCWQIIIHSILLQFLYFCGIHWDLSFIISYFAYLGSVSLLGEFGQIFVNLVYPFKEQALGFIDFFYCFFFNMFYFLSDIDCSLLLMAVCFVCSFPNSFWWRWSLKNLFNYELLRIAFATSNRFSMVVFSLSFVSKYFSVSSLIFSLTHWLF